MMKMRNTRPVGFGLVFWGLCFFFNPSFAVIDVLPDFIGCILICAGLSRVALVCPPMKEARAAFGKLAIADAVKTLSLLVIFSMGTTAEQPSALLLAAFAAAVVELMFLVPAVRSLFNGFSTLATKYDCEALYGNSLGGRSYTDRIERCTLHFLFFREAVCLLPEFAALATSSYSDSAWGRIYDHIGVMRAFSCILAGAFGIYWLIRILRYRRKLNREQNMLACVGSSCGEYLEAHPGIAVERRHGLAFLFLFAGMLFSVDFYLDFHNVIPDAVAGILLLIGALIPAVESKYRYATAAAAGVYTVIASISSHLSYRFVNQYSAGEIAKNQEAAEAYLGMWLMALAEFIAFLVLLVMLLLLLRAVIKQWAGYRAQHTSSDFEERCHRGLLAEFDGQLIRCFVFGFISGLLSFLYDYIKELPGRGILHVLEYTWMFDFCAALLFAILFGTLLTGIFKEIKNRFLYD